MTSDRTRLQIDQFEKALGRLRDALAVNETDVVRDALIRRFEFTFEMAWRSLWRWLNDRGERLLDKAYDALASTLQGKLIADAALWDRIREYRNLTSHTYKEETAIQVAAFVRSDAVQAFESALAELRRRERDPHSGAGVRTIGRGAGIRRDARGAQKAQVSNEEFGLAPVFCAKLRRAFEQTPGIDRVWIYGSRARGDHREESDIDLAVEASSEEAYSRAWRAVDALELLYRVDLVHIQRVSDTDFRSRIDRDKKVFWAPQQGVA